MQRPLPGRPGDGAGIIAGNNNNNIGNDINFNHWENNHQNVINNSPTIINNGYRPGVAWGGNGYGYRGDWGYGGGHFHDDSWCYGPGWRPAYMGYHGGWYHGSCNNDSDWGAFAAGALTGVATSWALGSRTYDWGYSNYSNPYYTPAVQTVVVQESPTPVYNYQQPINTEAPPPAADVAQPAVSTFDEARNMFRVGDYAQALSFTDQALASMPNDATMHEFRALVLFALNRYDESAAVLYSVLSVGPGWDWTTLAGLYDSLDTYTQQLRTLENYRRQHANEAAPTFLLAYHYLTAGHKEEAADLYEAVVKLQPGDTLSQGLLSALRPPAAQPATPPPPAPGATSPNDASQLVGDWKASADQNTTIALSLAADGKFTWDVVRGAQTHRLQGTYTLEESVLTLAQAEGDGGAMAGAVTPEGGGFRFRAIGAPADDKGLAFTK